MQRFYQVIKCICLGFAVSTLFISYSTASESGEAVSLGESIYREHCKVCHGDRGDGKTFTANVLKPAPKNFTNPMVIDTLSRVQMINSTAYGRPGTGMMPWKNILTEKEIETVVDYIRKAFMNR